MISFHGASKEFVSKCTYLISQIAPWYTDLKPICHVFPIAEVKFVYAYTENIEKYDVCVPSFAFFCSHEITAWFIAEQRNPASHFASWCGLARKWNHQNFSLVLLIIGIWATVDWLLFVGLKTSTKNECIIYNEIPIFNYTDIDINITWNFIAEVLDWLIFGHFSSEKREKSIDRSSMSISIVCITRCNKNVRISFPLIRIVVGKSTSHVIVFNTHSPLAQTNSAKPHILLLQNPNE